MSLDVYLHDETGEQVYWANITHNLNRMAEHCGFYKPLWRPDEIGLVKAKDVADAMRQGIGYLAMHPVECSAFNSPNGWGVYEHFVPFCLKYLEACDRNPEATVYVSR